MQTFRREKKTGMSMERVSTLADGRECEKGESNGMEKYSGSTLVVKGLIPKEEKFDSFPPVGSGEPSKIMLYLLGLQFHYLRSCLFFFL